MPLAILVESEIAQVNEKVPLSTGDIAVIATVPYRAGTEVVGVENPALPFTEVASPALNVVVPGAPV